METPKDFLGGYEVLTEDARNTRDERINKRVSRTGFTAMVGDIYLCGNVGSKKVTIDGKETLIFAYMATRQRNGVEKAVAVPDSTFSYFMKDRSEFLKRTAFLRDFADCTTVEQVDALLQSKPIKVVEIVKLPTKKYNSDEYEDRLYIVFDYA